MELGKVNSVIIENLEKFPLELKPILNAENYRE